MKIFIKTYGCQMNERDSETIASQLEHAGYGMVGNEREADVVILNTCSIREQAEIKAIGKAGYLSRRKRTNKNFRIGVVGCMAENLGPELFRLNDSIDFIVGPRRIHELTDVLKNVDQGGAKVSKIGEAEEWPTPPNFGHPLKGRKPTAFLSIARGCNMRCSYCIVPKTRGKERYRPMDNVVAEAEFLVADGVKEITLLGQTVNGYGSGKMPVVKGKTPFVQLLERLNTIVGLSRIRYLSPHPRHFSDDLIMAHGNLSKLCPSVHLPIQSGSNRILRAMGRAHSRETIIDIAKKLRHVNHEIGISTDVIVGFPGETPRDFEETLDLIDGIKFNMAFIFKYSPRPGTKSSELVDDVSDEEKERRNRMLLSHVEKFSILYNRQWLGRIVDVLVEGPAKRGKNVMFGWTPNHCKVLFEAVESDVGKIISVKISDSATTVLLGTRTMTPS